MCQHPVWYRDMYTQKFNQVIGILELAARTAQRSSDVVDTTQTSKRKASSDPPSQSRAVRPRTRSPSPPDASDAQAEPSGGGERGSEALQPAEPERPPAPPAQCEAPRNREDEATGPSDPRQAQIHRATLRGHALVVQPTHVFCRRCARSAEKRWRGLDSEPCKGPNAGASHHRDFKLRRLAAGLHPNTGMPFA